MAYCLTYSGFTRLHLIAQSLLQGQADFAGSLPRVVSLADVKLDSSGTLERGAKSPFTAHLQEGRRHSENLPPPRIGGAKETALRNTHQVSFLQGSEIMGMLSTPVVSRFFPARGCTSLQIFLLGRFHDLDRWISEY